jgi:hypothetical protein
MSKMTRNKVIKLNLLIGMKSEMEMKSKIGMK